MTQTIPRPARPAAKKAGILAPVDAGAVAVAEHPATTAIAPLRVGVIGLGMGRAHALAYAGIEGVEVVALAAKEAPVLAALGSELSVPNLFDEWQDLVALDDIDIVSVAVPNLLHHPITMAALAAGKHVFCEKPLAIDAAHAREMVDAARAAGRVLEVSFNHRRRADVQYIRNYLTNTGIGKIYHVRASWKRRAGIPGLNSWFTNKKLAGGGALIDLGPHILDTVLYLLGEPKVTAVSAVSHGHVGSAGYGAMSGGNHTGTNTAFEVDDLSSALLRLDTGASVQFEISWAGHTVDEDDISVELLGVDGGVRLFVNRYAQKDTVRIYRDVDGAHTTLVPEVHVPGGEHAIVIGEFIDTVRSGKWSSAHGDYALHRTEVLDACYESARLNREVVIA